MPGKTMNLSILIADDEPIIRLGLKSMLQQLGHRVTAASNGREALRLARRQRFDLAIFDIKMPYTDGLQAAETLQRVAPLPVIFLTAYSEADLIAQATDLSVHGYLVKPVQMEQLAATIAVARKRFAEQQAAVETNAQLSRQLAERKLVARAKGRLMTDRGLSEEEAYRWLQHQARDSRRSLVEVATEVLAG
jgi:response regulator NasT